MNTVSRAYETFLELVIPEETIVERIIEVAEQIDREYEGKELLIITILKGSICLVADLIRQLNGPNIVEFIRCSSYGASGHVRGRLRITGLDQLEVEGKDILLIDDIFDSGHTLTAVFSRLQELKPASLKTLVLLAKRVPRKVPFQPHFVLFEIEDRFVVGYGLDYKERFRGLKGVYALLLENLPQKV
ncbi:MAG: hypoxanthine phosphoribosyltransferase [Simkania sp.]|nr:hypoxanthine phosphoribosyltransferase [Simkania sp.]